jgi:hypothetical protein
MIQSLSFFKQETAEISTDSYHEFFWKSKSSRANFLIIYLLLILSTAVIYKYNIEEHLGFSSFMPIILGAFTIHSLLPKSYRLAFFFFASLYGIVYVFGGLHGGLLICVAFVMIGACHLPISLILRKIIVILLGLGLAYSQYQIVSTGFLATIPFSSKLISLLGVMFMFRVIIYLYELKYQKQGSSIWQILSYFFMLPNICFPIFPIIDFKTFKATYYNQPDTEIYSKGIESIIIGIIQLLCYRALYYLVPQINNVQGLSMLVYYIGVSYLLLIRLNGMLNLAVGILRLFGFNLPDIFNYMFLAHGFDDYWRRINIYWKDFMVKIFYYPIYFKFRKKSVLLALSIGTIFTFFFNWLLHSYQWFWILGKFSIRGTEILFWSILALLVLLSVIQQNLNKGKISKVEIDQNTWSFSLIKSFKILSTFCVVALVYSIYTSTTISDWLNLISRSQATTLKEIGEVISAISIIGLTGALLLKLTAEDKFLWIEDIFTKRRNIRLIQFSLLLILLVTTTSFVKNSLNKYQSSLLSMYISHKPNKTDSQLQSKGYYEEILLSDNFSSPLWQRESQKPATWKNLSSTGVVIKTGLYQGLKPYVDINFKNARLTTNQYGLRDKEYSLKRHENTVRIAIIGGSLEMGTGVENEEIFENLVEEKLNNDFGSDAQQFEIINFAISGLSSIRNTEKLHRDVLKFEPQYVIVNIHNEEIFHFQKTLRLIKNIQEDSIQIENLRMISPWFIEFEHFLQKESIAYNPDQPDEVKISHGKKIMEWTFRHMKHTCDSNNCEFILAIVPGIQRKSENYPIIDDIIKSTATKTFDLRNAYQGYSPDELSITSWDNHPNPLGHKLIAKQYYIELVRHLNIKHN